MIVGGAPILRTGRPVGGKRIKLLNFIPVVWSQYSTLDPNIWGLSQNWMMMTQSPIRLRSYKYTGTTLKGCKGLRKWSYGKALEKRNQTQYCSPGHKAEGMSCPSPPREHNQGDIHMGSSPTKGPVDLNLTWGALASPPRVIYGFWVPPGFQCLTPIWNVDWVQHRSLLGLILTESFSYSVSVLICGFFFSFVFSVSTGLNREKF